ncbi:MAG: peptidylprolyl isomerase [Rhodothermales bacterium]|nr:peptidylprolyl isomerase [Rhodothermales bacterium]
MRSLFLIALTVAGIAVAGCSGAGRSTSTPNIPPDAVAHIAGQSLSLDEFETRYARSVGGRQQAIEDSLAEYRDFLNRYTDFRMKVLYAEELGFDQDTTLLSEIDAYRKQLARPYLLEREIMEPILRQLYERRQQIVDASHILVRVAEDASPADTLAAFTKLMAMRDSVMSGVDFGDLAFRNSEDPSARGDGPGGRGRLGYFSGGQMVEAFENVGYSTPVGDVSPVFRSQFGYHILQVHDRRGRVPDRWASHIAVRELASTTQQATPRERIEALRARLLAGEEFRVVATEKSEDTQSGSRGGQLGRVAFTTPQLPPAFKDALFALEKEGDFSDIIETSYGLHIVRLDQIEVPQTFEESYEELKMTASRLPRVRAAEDRMALEIREKQGIFVDTTAILATLNGRPFRARDILETPAAEMQRIVIGVGTQRFTFGDVVNFAETANQAYIADTLGRVYQTIDMFLNNAALDYEAAQLESTNEDFKGIMGEFRDGLLLFKLMEDSIWTAAARDTASLVAYHDARVDSFSFPDRTRIVSVRAKSDSSLRAITAHLGHGVSVKDLVATASRDTVNVVEIDTTYLAGPNNSIYDRALGLSAGQATEPILNAGSFIALINDGTEPARLKTFTEARSEVLSAYQELQEAKLLARLRKKYATQLFPEQLVGLYAEEKQRAATAKITDLTAPENVND